MGFPRSWCLRARGATNNDVDSALSYILSHGEELSTAEETDLLAATSGVRGVEGEAGEAEVYVYDPLSAVSGTYDVTVDLALSSKEGFPSVGAKAFGVTSGQWCVCLCFMPLFLSLSFSFSLSFSLFLSPSPH